MNAAFAMATIRFARIAQASLMEIPLLMSAAYAIVIHLMIAFRIVLENMADQPMLTSAESAMTALKMIVSKIALVFVLLLLHL